LIEVQTISFVTGTACVDRTPSITDRALISPFLDQLSDQCALADVLPQTEACPRIEEGAAALEIQLATGVYRVVQGTFRLQGSDLKMQVALDIQDTTLKKAKPKHFVETYPQMFDVRAEFDAVLFKRTMTLNALRALSEGDTIKFPKAALEQIMLCPKGEGPVGYLGKSNGLYAVSFPSENKADASDAMEIELLAQSVDGAESAEEIDQYLSDLKGLVENTDGSEGDPPNPSKSVRHPSLRVRGVQRTFQRPLQQGKSIGWFRQRKLRQLMAQGTNPPGPNPYQI
jgi:flagellar motor switch/type III secretory pathway protein FliN